MKHPFSNLVPLLCALALGVSSARGAELVTTNASPEARALLNFLYSMYGKKTLSGQMWTPAGADEIETVHKITGKYPAIRGQDYITEKTNAHENQLAIEWWKAGGIPTIMWHWGAPTKGEGYEQSKMTIDMDRCFQPGTEEYTAMWSDLKRIADHLTVLRDAHVPVLWRPMHECDGGWFWYSKGGGERFVRLWRTMFDYFTKDRKLDNLIWVLCHSGNPKADFDPGRSYYDIAGGDSYGRGIQEGLWNRVKALHPDGILLCYHECGTLPDPDQSFQKQVTWSWWMLWHTRHLLNHDKQALIHVYNHELVLTRDELPNIMDYLHGEPAALEPTALRRDEMLVNGSFANGTAHWVVEESGATGLAECVKEGPDGKASLRLTVLTVGDKAWRLQLFHAGFGVEKGRTYDLTFWARSDRPGSITVNCMQNHEPWDHHTQIKLPVSTEWKPMHFTFVGAWTDDKVRICFTDLGTTPGQVYWFADCSLVPPNSP